MQEERMQILKMVEEGKINADEGVKLFEALKTGTPSVSFEEKFNKFAKDTGDFFKEIGDKVNEMYKKAEPKIKDATKTVVAKTAKVCDNISQGLNEKVRKMEGVVECNPCGCETPCDAPCTDDDNAPREN